MTASILREISDDKRQWVRHCKQRCSEAELLRRADDHTPRDFVGALTSCISQDQNAVIAEVKKASPSKGLIRADFDPVKIAKSYADHGAACLSVLTDEHYFQGSDTYLTAIHAAVEIPVLRKDFMLDPYQVIEARALGADAMLIILAMVDDGLADELCAAAREMQLAVLPEIHNRHELERAQRLNTRLIGINNRDLHSFETSIATTCQLLPHVPEGCVVITESGIHHPADIKTMNDAGIHGFLIGESLMRQPDPGKALASLLKKSNS